MHCPALLQLCNPKVSGGDADASAPAPEALSSCTDVIWPPVVNAPICQRDHPGHRGAEAVTGDAVQMAGGPHGATKALYPFFGSFRSIKKDFDSVEGTCFRWDKPGGR